MTRPTHEEIKTAKAKGCPIAWMKCAEIEKAGDFDAWDRADQARLAGNREAAQAWAKAEAARINKRARR